MKQERVEWWIAVSARDRREMVIDSFDVPARRPPTPQAKNPH